MERRVRIAITGGIGSGKSYVCRFLRRRGIEIYDCDAAAKRLMKESDVIRCQLTALIGDNAYVDGLLNKEAVAIYMMQSDEHTACVNAVVHPAVADDFQKSGMAWMECAILFESGFDRYVDKVVCVAAPEDVRIRRVMRRDGISRDKVLEWMAKQLPQYEVMERSDYVVVNDGAADITEQLEYIFQDLDIHEKG